MVHYPYLEIKYKKMLPILLLVASVLNLGLSLVAGLTLNIVTGLVLLLVGILMLKRPVIVITPSEIQMKSLLGRTGKKHSYTPDQISLRSGSLYVNNKKIFTTWWVDITTNQLRAFFAQDLG